MAIICRQATKLLLTKDLQKATFSTLVLKTSETVAFFFLTIAYRLGYKSLNATPYIFPKPNLRMHICILVLCMGMASPFKLLTNHARTGCSATTLLGTGGIVRRSHSTLSRPRVEWSDDRIHALTLLPRSTFLRRGRLGRPSAIGHRFGLLVGRK